MTVTGQSFLFVLLFGFLFAACITRSARIIKPSNKAVNQGGHMESHVRTPTTRTGSRAGLVDSKRLLHGSLLDFNTRGLKQIKFVS